MVACWHTLALFVACCPKPENVAPEQVVCPSDADVIEPCCTPAIFTKVLRSFGTLSQGEVMRAMPEEDYLQTLFLIRDQLHSFVRDIDVLSVDAWQLLAIAAARYAIAGADDLKDSSVGPQTPEGMHSLWRRALTQSRQLGKALFRIENFQQFLLAGTSHFQGELLQGFDPEQVRDNFAPALEVYKEAVRAHDLLAYSLIPQLERRAQAEPQFTDSPVINLLVVSLGSYAKTGFLTIWTVLRKATCPLRIFVLGDPVGLEAWRGAVEELADNGEAKVLFERVVFEYIDFAAHPRFRSYLRRYPTGCSFGEAGTAILARVVCHEVLPPDVSRVIAMDLGDMLVLDDIRELWDLGDRLEKHQILAAAHAVSLHHVNGGLVVYEVSRMRERNFSAVTLRAARDQLRRDKAQPNYDGVCLRDQSIINVLHSFREELGYEGPSPVMLLPCRWSVFPVTEWQPHWNVPDEWLPEVVERRRYPGIVSADRVEVYCPDEVDMLSAWAWIPMTEHSDGQTRQSRLRVWAHHEGRKRTRYCSSARMGAGDEKCCRCGESAALVHIAGDMKMWPAMQNFIRAHWPPWKEPPAEDVLLRASSTDWWGGEARARRMLDNTEKQAYVVARTLGLNAQFSRCITVSTVPADDPLSMVYHQASLRPRLPVDLWVETTAREDAHLLVGIGGHSGLELVMGSEGGTATQIRLVRSSPGWATRGELLRFPNSAQSTRPRQTEEQEQGEEVDQWVAFKLHVSEDQTFEVTFNGISWQSWLPEEAFWMLRHVPLTVSVACQVAAAKWGICNGPEP